MPKRVIIVHSDEPIPEIPTQDVGHNTSVVHYDYDTVGLDWTGSGNFVIWALETMILLAILVFIIIIIRNALLVWKANNKWMKMMDSSSVDENFRASLEKMIEEEVQKRLAGIEDTHSSDKAF